MVHVPFKGTAPALNAIIGNQVDVIFMELASALKLHEAGKARILAVATEKRLPNLPDVPTMEEAGLKDFTSDTFNAISAPPRTPKPIVDKLNKAINAVLQEPDVRAHFAKVNLTPAGGTPAEAKAFIQAETKKWGDVIKEAHVPMR
jgi:tripartite-type tricarboxylate transporter receptor subunit TctC